MAKGPVKHNASKRVRNLKEVARPSFVCKRRFKKGNDIYWNVDGKVDNPTKLVDKDVNINGVKRRVVDVLYDNGFATFVTKNAV